MVRNLGQNKSYHLDEGVGVDQEGYILTPGDDTTAYRDTVRKATVGDPFAGVVYRSTRGDGRIGDMEVREGEPCAVQMDGYCNVLIDASGVDQVTAFEDSVYIGTTEGVGTVDDSGTEGTDYGAEVGVVINSHDLSDFDGVEQVQVSITGKLGDS